jgi:hypothetical protein
MPVIGQQVLFQKWNTLHEALFFIRAWSLSGSSSYVNTSSPSKTTEAFSNHITIRPIRSPE